MLRKLAFAGLLVASLAWGDDDNDPVTFELFVNTSTWDAENKWAGWNRSWVNVTITKKQMFDDVIEAQWPSNAVYSQLGAEYMGNTTALSEMGKAPFEGTMESNAKVWNIDPWGKTHVLAPMGILALDWASYQWVLGEYHAVLAVFYQWMCHHTGDLYPEYVKAAALLRRAATASAGPAVPFAKIDRYALPRWPERNDTQNITGEWQDWNIPSVTPQLRLFVERVPLVFKTRAAETKAEALAEWVDARAREPLYKVVDTPADVMRERIVAAAADGGGASVVPAPALLAFYDEAAGVAARRCLIALASELMEWRKTGPAVVLLTTNSSELRKAYSVPSRIAGVLLGGAKSDGVQRLASGVLAGCDHHTDGAASAATRAAVQALQSAAADTAKQQRAADAANAQCKARWEEPLAQFEGCAGAQGELECQLRAMLPAAASDEDDLRNKVASIVSLPRAPCDAQTGELTPPAKGVCAACGALLRHATAVLAEPAVVAAARSVAISVANGSSTAPATALYRLGALAVELGSWAAAEQLLELALDMAPPASAFNGDAGGNNRDELFGIGLGHSHKLLSHAHEQMSAGTDAAATAARLAAANGAAAAFLAATGAAADADAAYAQNAMVAARKRFAQTSSPLKPAGGGDLQHPCATPEPRPAEQWDAAAPQPSGGVPRLLSGLATAGEVHALMGAAGGALVKLDRGAPDPSGRYPGEAVARVTHLAEVEGWKAAYDTTDAAAATSTEATSALSPAAAVAAIARRVESAGLLRGARAEGGCFAGASVVLHVGGSSGGATDGSDSTTAAPALASDCHAPLSQAGAEAIGAGGQRRTSVTVFLGFEGSYVDEEGGNARRGWLAFPAGARGTSFAPAKGDALLSSTARAMGLIDYEATYVPCAQTAADRGFAAQLFFSCPIAPPARASPPSSGFAEQPPLVLAAYGLLVSGSPVVVVGRRRLRSRCWLPATALRLLTDAHPRVSLPPSLHRPSAWCVACSSAASALSARSRAMKRAAQ